MTLAFRGKKVIARQQRHRPRSHISKDKAAEFLRRITGMLDAVFEFASFRLTRCLQDTTIIAIKPAMIAAADAVFLDSAEAKIGSAVRALGADDRRPAGGVAVQNQIFAEDANIRRLFLQVSRDADRPPVAPQQPTHRRAGTNAG